MSKKLRGKRKWKESKEREITEEERGRYSRFLPVEGSVQ
jgi:hypothetical protein